jgi:predicted nucleic acid-binding protein
MSKVIIDSDFWFSYFFEDQSTHIKAKEIVSTIVNDELFILNLVLQELATVISRKKSQEKAVFVIDTIEKFKLQVIRLSEEDESQIWRMFKSFSKQNISFIDCANLYYAQKMNSKIASFDKFYPKESLLI